MSIEKVLKRIIQIGSSLILFAPLLVNGNFLFPYIHLKNIFFRLLVLALVVLWLWYAIETGKVRGKGNMILLAVAALVVVYIIAGLFGVNPYNSFWGNYERMDGVINYIFLLAYFFIVLNVFTAKEEWLWLLRSSLLAALLVSGYGFLQKMGVQADWIYGNKARLDATIGNAAFLAGYLLLHVFLAWGLFVWDKARQWRWFYVVSIFVYIVIIYFTATRGAMLAGAGGALLVWLLNAVKSGKKQKISFVVVVALLIASGLWLRGQSQSQWIKKFPPLQRLASISLQDTTTADRLVTWRISWMAFQDRPILGWGPENYRYGFNKYYSPALHEPWFDRAHNVILDYLNAAGAVGLAAYLFVLGSAFWYAILVWKKDYKLGAVFIALLAAYLGQNLFVFDTLNTFLPFFISLAWIGFVAREEKEDLFWKLKPIVYAWRKVILAVVVIIIIFIANGVVLKPARANLLSIKAYATRNQKTALSYFKQALALNTFGNREISLQLANVARRIISSNSDLEIKQEFFQTAAGSLEKILERDPADIQSRLVLASLYQAYAKIDPSYIDKSIALFDGHINDSPQRLEIYFTLAQSYLLKNNVAKAVDYLRRALSITNRKHTAYLNLLNLYSQIGDVDNFLPLVDEYRSNLKLAPIHYRQLAQFYARLGFFRQAEDIVRSQLLNNSPSWDDYQFLVYLLDKQGRRDEGLAMLDKLYLAYPEWRGQIEGLKKFLLSSSSTSTLSK